VEHRVSGEAGKTFQTAEDFGCKEFVAETDNKYKNGTSKCGNN
jgi:hypothetical protein